MSVFTPGGDLKSTNIPSAFFEITRQLDNDENTRNRENPGLTPRRNLSANISFDTGTIGIAATLPINTVIQGNGTPQINVNNYLGPYSALTAGGDTKSTNSVAAFLEIASLLAAAEKSITPVENQPNNIQIVYDLEAGNAVISASLPFIATVASDGSISIEAADYL